MMHFFFEMVTAYRLAYKNPGEIGEDIGLDESNQYFNKVNKNRKCNGHRGKCHPC